MIKLTRKELDTFYGTHTAVAVAWVALWLMVGTVGNIIGAIIGYFLCMLWAAWRLDTSTPVWEVEYKFTSFNDVVAFCGARVRNPDGTWVGYPLQLPPLDGILFTNKPPEVPNHASDV